MAYDIEFINDMAYTVDYSETALAEYDAGNEDVGDEYTLRFEREYGVSNGDDIGGLVVYTVGDTVRAVYDYENFVGWVV